MLFSFPLSCRAAHLAYMVNIQNVDQHLNLRLNPSIDSKVIGHLGNGRCVLSTDITHLGDKHKWLQLIHPKGWVSLKYLRESNECTELFEIVNRMFSIVKEQCEDQFYDSPNQPEKYDNQKKEFVSSIMNDVVTLDGYCDICDPCEGEKTKNDKVIQDIASSLPGPFCTEDVCIQGEGFCNYNKCEEMPIKCSTPYESFLNGLSVSKARFGYEIYRGGFDCCGGTHYIFKEIDGEWKITSIFIHCD